MNQSAESRGAILRSPIFATPLVILLLVSVAAQLPAGRKRESLPNFKTFPALEVWKGPPAPLRLLGRDERMFRSNLRTAANLPPNFAGHYHFTTWGCGTRCLAGAVIDLRTGTIFQPPLAADVTGEEHWIFCTDWNDEHTVEYRRDSRLMIIRCGGTETDAHGTSVPEVYYFVWEHNDFRLILHTHRARKTSP